MNYLWTIVSNKGCEFEVFAPTLLEALTKVRESTNGSEFEKDITLRPEKMQECVEE